MSGDRLDLLDWRRRLVDLCAEVRERYRRDPSDAHECWRTGRDALLAGHPSSPLPTRRRPSFTGLPVAPCDPQLVFAARVDTDVTPSASRWPRAPAASWPTNASGRRSPDRPARAAGARQVRGPGLPAVPGRHRGPHDLRLRAGYEARSLLHEAFTTPADLHIGNGQLRVTLNPLSTPARTHAVASLCDELTSTHAVYSGTDLTLTYNIKNPSDLA